MDQKLRPYSEDEGPRSNAAKLCTDSEGTRSNPIRLLHLEDHHKDVEDDDAKGDVLEMGVPRGMARRKQNANPVLAHLHNPIGVNGCCTLVVVRVGKHPSTETLTTQGVPFAHAVGFAKGRCGAMSSQNVFTQCSRKVGRADVVAREDPSCRGVRGDEVENAELEGKEMIDHSSDSWRISLESASPRPCYHWALTQTTQTTIFPKQTCLTIKVRSNLRYLGGTYAPRFRRQPLALAGEMLPAVRLLSGEWLLQEAAPPRMPATSAPQSSGIDGWPRHAHPSRRIGRH